MEKDGDLYISPATEYCRMYVNHKEIKGPTLLSPKAEIEIDSQYLKFEKIPAVKKDEPLKTTLAEISSTVSINETPDICNDRPKVTEVIESNPNDNNEKYTSIPDNNEKDTSIPDKNETDTPIPETALPYKPAELTPEQSVLPTQLFDSGASVPTLSPSYSLRAPPETPPPRDTSGPPPPVTPTSPRTTSGIMPRSGIMPTTPPTLVKSAWSAGASATVKEPPARKPSPPRYKFEGTPGTTNVYLMTPPSSPNITKNEDTIDKTRSNYQPHCARLLSLLADGDPRPLVNGAPSPLGDTEATGFEGFTRVRRREHNKLQRRIYEAQPTPSRSKSKGSSHYLGALLPA